VRYRIGRLTNGWAVIASTANATITTLTIPRVNGLAEYAVFAEYTNGQAAPSAHFFLSK